MTTAEKSTPRRPQIEAADPARTSKAAIAAAIGMPAAALTNKATNLSDLSTTPRYEIERER